MEELRQEGQQVAAFGRHRGLTFLQIYREEPGYLQWALEKEKDGWMKLSAWKFIDPEKSMS